METIYLKPKDFVRKWYVIDAAGKTLGHIATKAAYVLRGKNKPYYVPHHECGDFVIIINAEKVQVSGGKELKKMYYAHSRHPGGLSTYTLKAMLERKPVYPLEMAIKGMLPKTRLGRSIYTNLKVYAGNEHPHAAQKPEVLSID